MVLKFGLNRLRRSPSSSPNPFGGFHHHACMQACRFKPTRSPAHSHCLIAQIRLVHNVPHSLFNVWAQRSHKLHNRFHTTRVGCCGHHTGARLPLVHSQCWYKLLFGPFVLAPALHNTPASFLQMTMAQLHRQQDHRQGCRHKDTRTMQTHTHTGTHSVPRHAQISQRCVRLLQNNPDDTISPHAARLIYPITFLITGWL